MTGQVENRRLTAARAALCFSVIAFLSALWMLLASEKPQEKQIDAVRAPGQVMAEFLTDRDALRREEISQLQELSQAQGTSEEIKSMAQRRILLLRQWMEQEATIESVLSARGYEPVLVTVHSDSVNVLIACDRLERSDAAVILELASRETGITGGNIKIIPIN